MSFVPQASLNADLANYQPKEIETARRFCEQMAGCAASPDLVMANFSRFVRMQDISRFLVMHELFQQTLEVHGSIVELGVLNGFNIFTMAHLTEIFEHRNFTRKIYGFDTFDGYVGHGEEHDGAKYANDDIEVFKTEDYENLQASVALFNETIQFNQFEKISLIKGDASESVPRFVEDHPELIVSLLLCQCDIYQPTRDTLEALLPRMPVGGIVAFGALNYDGSPGETKALREVLDIGAFQLKRFSFATKAAYLIKQ